MKTITFGVFLQKLGEEAYRRAFGKFIQEKRLELFGRKWAQPKSLAPAGFELQERTWRRVELGEVQPSDDTLNVITTVLGYKSRDVLVNDFEQWYADLHSDSERNQKKQFTKIEHNFIKRNVPKVLRAGYAHFPPYTILSQEIDKPIGFSIDLVDAISERYSPKIAVEWHKYNFHSMHSELEAGRFDFLADPIYRTPSRELKFRYCLPFQFFKICVGVVRKNDNRFRSFEDLDRSDITIALATGWSSAEFATQRLSSPKFKYLTITDESSVLFDQVRFGHADIALNDFPTVIQYVQRHSETVEPLWMDEGRFTVAGGFVCRADDIDLAIFLDHSIRDCMADGVLRSLQYKWNAFGLLSEYKFPQLAIPAAEPE
jgi:ABC-type amino acid transport substrate-binding protein